MLDIQFQRTKDDRVDNEKRVAWNEEPGHEDKVKAHIERVQAEYFDKKGKKPQDNK